MESEQPSYQCPCQMNKDIFESEDVYFFILENYPEIDFKEKWDDMPPAHLKCTYCILSTALTLLRKQNYNVMEISKLSEAVDIVSRRFVSYMEKERNSCKRL